eukprot:PhF_6_TR15970/c0_g2_i6/m.24974
MSLEECIGLADFGDFAVCTICNRGMWKSDEKKHMMSEHNVTVNDSHRCKEMTSEYVVNEVSQWMMKQQQSTMTTNSHEMAPVYVYTMQSPLCYGGNRAMRSVRGD